LISRQIFRTTGRGPALPAPEAFPEPQPHRFFMTDFTIGSVHHGLRVRRGAQGRPEQSSSPRLNNIILRHVAAQPRKGPTPPPHRLRAAR
jgi:hypothetical protein